jgi:hypothetical protein
MRLDPRVSPIRQPGLPGVVTCWFQELQVAAEPPWKPLVEQYAPRRSTDSGSC